MNVVLRLVVLVLGLALAALGLLVVAETVVAGLGRDPLLVDPAVIGGSVRGLSWDAPELLPVWVALIAVGLLLWVLAALRGQPSVLVLPSGEGRYADINRRSLGSVLGDVARDQDGVRSASVSVSKAAARVEVVARPGADPRVVRERVESAVGERLAGLQLERLRARVSVSRSRERS